MTRLCRWSCSLVLRILVISLVSKIAYTSTSPMWMDLGKSATVQQFVNFNEVIKVETGTDATGNLLLRLYVLGTTGSLVTADTAAINRVKAEVTLEKWLQVEPKVGYAFMRPDSIQAAQFSCSAATPPTCTATLQTAAGVQGTVIDGGDYSQLSQTMSSSPKQWFAVQVTTSAQAYVNLTYVGNVTFESVSSSGGTKTCTGTLATRNGTKVTVKDSQGLARLQALFGMTCP